MNKKKITIALAGNPNTGKTTLFNALTGSNQRTGNYAGVTVEKKWSVRKYKGYEFTIYDLPGTYSLTAYSLDEIVARDFIIDEKPDIIIDVLDSTNIERNLFLSLQFHELEVPIIGVLNLCDQAKERGINIDANKLSELLKFPFLETIASKGIGVEQILDRSIEVKENSNKVHHPVTYGSILEPEIEKLQSILSKDENFKTKYPLRWFAIKLLEKDNNAIEILEKHLFNEEVNEYLTAATHRLEKHYDRDTEILMSEQRYGYIHGATKEAIQRKSLLRQPGTELIDKILLNRVIGFPIFLGILWFIFHLTFTFGEYPMQYIEMFFGWASNMGTQYLPDGIVKSLLVDGVIAGVGGVMSFVPLIVLLFFFISFLEDTGYMARAAFIMDKFLHIFGLHGQSFLPMILGFGCSVPAVMASRTLRSRKDRIITVIVTPFMSCGAKLPVHTLLAAAFFGKFAGNVVLSIYIIGVVLGLLSSLIFRKFVLKGESTPFVMELPPYRMPTLFNMFRHAGDKTFEYLKKAGTILLPASILIWAVTTFPEAKFDEAKYNTMEKTLRQQYSVPLSQEPKTGIKNNVNSSPSLMTADEISRKVERDIAHAKSLDAISSSYAGQFGQWIEPAVAPIGFDWKTGISAITGLAAKEMVVSTLGVLYKVGNEETEESESLRQALRDDPAFSPLVAYVLMLFTLIVVPCFAALAAIRAEIGWKWLGVAVFYWMGLAWSLCFVVYQVGSFFVGK